MDQSNLKWDWMSNVSLQSHSLHALPYSLPALSLLLSLLHQWTSSGSCILFPWIGEYIIEQIYQLSYGFDAFSNASWSQFLMALGLGWNERQILTKKLIVNTTSKLDVDFSRLDIATNVVLNGLVSFVSSKMIAVPHLNGKLAFVEGCVHFRHSDTQMTNIFQEWNEVARVVWCMTGITFSNQRMTHRWGSAARTVPSTRAEPKFEPFSFIPRT